MPFEERQFSLNETQSSVECHMGSIRTQEFHRQTPLQPSVPEDLNKLYSRFGPSLTPHPLEYHENDRLEKGNHNEGNEQKKSVEVEQSLLHQINSRLNYYKLRHNHKIAAST